MTKVLYHGKCKDGFAAAWAAWMILGDQAEYIPCQYGATEFPDVVDEEVYVLDYSFPRETMKRLCDEARHVTLLDHHISAVNDLEGWDVRYVPLAGGGEAIVDTRDYPLVCGFSWSEAKHGGAIAYRSGGRSEQDLVYMHRLLLGEDGENIDHINRNPLDNRRSNLRFATKQQNAANMDQGSRWKGVRVSGKKWCAQITINGKNNHLGSFTTPEEAAKAYDSAALAAFGPYARGNFIQPPEPPPLPPRNLEIHFDMEQSGAGLAWRYFHTAKEFPGPPEVPWLIKYTEDRDLWRWALPDSKIINSYLQTVPHDFEEYSRVAAKSIKEARALGEGSYAWMRQYVEATKPLATLQEFLGHQDIPVVNAPYTAISEVVGELAEDREFAVGWHVRESGDFVYSLRSKHGFDVAALAQTMGGGGHKAASGFRSDRGPWDLESGVAS